MYITIAKMRNVNKKYFDIFRLVIICTESVQQYDEYRNCYCKILDYKNNSGCCNNKTEF